MQLCNLYLTEVRLAVWTSWQDLQVKWRIEIKIWHEDTILKVSFLQNFGFMADQIAEMKNEKAFSAT